MSKYRIVKHRAGDSIGYCPEIWECPISIWGVKESWRKLAGNENLTSLDLWVRSLPKTIEDAKDIIENHIEDQKPKYSEEVVYEYDTKKKEKQKKLLTEIIEADQKNGLYDISDEQKNMTAVQWFIEKTTESGHLWLTDKPYGMDELDLIIEAAKQMEEEQHKETFKQSRQAKIFEKDLPPVWESFEQYYTETYGK